MNDSGRITIRPWKRSDAESLASVLSNQKLLKNLRDGIPYPYTKEDALEYIDAMLAADPKGTFAYAIDLDGRAVGSVSAFRQENIHSRSAELGYYLAEEHWGKGFMTEAVKMLCRKLFQETDLVRIFAGPFSYNLGSRGVLEQAGFVFEGILHGHAVKNDRILDVALYALVKKPEHVTVRRLSPEEIPGY